jgi:curved DNA-binding protein CbpA
MRSAYLVLGVPGDANREEIEAAFRRAEAQFPRERLAQEEGALARLGEIRSAYQVLNDPDSRAAHDRKLQAQVRPPPQPRTVVLTEEASPLRKWIVAGVWLLVVMLASGIYLSHRNAEARRFAAVQEAAARKAAEQEAEARRQEQDRLAAERAALAARAEANERRLLADINGSRAVATQRMQEAAVLQVQRQEQAEARRRDSERLYEERRAAVESRQAAAEAQRRIERDKQRVRELCWRTYGRPDC